MIGLLLVWQLTPRAQNECPSSRWNAKRNLNRLFVVCAVCWYVAGGFVLWPKWTAALNAEKIVLPEGYTFVPEEPKTVRHEPDVLDRIIAEAPPIQRPIGLTLAFLAAPPTL